MSSPSQSGSHRQVSLRSLRKTGGRNSIRGEWDTPVLPLHQDRVSFRLGGLGGGSGSALAAAVSSAERDG